MLKRKAPSAYTNKPYKNPRTSTTKTKAENAQIARIARKVLIGAAETKLWAAQTSFNIIDNSFYAINVNGPIITGSASDARIGTKIQMMNIRIHALFYTNGASSTTTKVFRVAVIKTPQRLTDTAATIALADVLKQNTTATIPTGHFDLKKVKLLYDETFTQTPEYGATPQVRLMPLQMSVPVKKTEIYESDTSKYIQSGNYYILMGAYDNNGAVTPGGFNLAYTVSFKDE